ncbi:cytoplasmic tRNA 2-thiolation protein 2, partial [Asbolus verrucosus]
MCSVGDDGFDETENLKYMPKKEKPSIYDKCNKCREEPPCIVLRSKDKYCKQCFLAGTIHKFKALLGKHKLIHPNDRVMIIHKCGQPSSALLHFIRTGLDLETHKRLRFEPLILFIEDQLHLSLEARQELINNVEKEVGYFNFPKYFTSITQLITASPPENALQAKSELLKLGEDDKTILDRFLEHQTNETNKNDFLNIIVLLWVEVAKNLKCKFIFTPEISSDIASQLLTDISTGRGPHVPLDTGFCDSRDDEVKILRPLRLFDAKELAFYNHLNNLEPVTVRARKDEPYRSIQNLMKRFVNDLQMNYPATVTTVLKTGDKLSVDKESNEKCNFCNAPINEGNEELTSAESTQFSHWVSTQTPDYTVASEDRYNKILKSFQNISFN